MQCGTDFVPITHYMKRVVVFMALMGLLVGIPGCAPKPKQISTQEPEQSPASPEAKRRSMLQDAKKRVVTLFAYDGEGEKIGQGSGFLWRKRQVITNAHVIEGAAYVEILGVGQTLLATAPYALALDAENDIAILPAPGIDISGLRAASRDAETGINVWALGAPLGLDATVSKGIVAASREIDGRQLIQITAPISQGSSGGPVINKHGDVVGVVVGLLSGGQNLNFAVPADLIPDTVAEDSVRLKFPEKTRQDDLKTSSDQEAIVRRFLKALEEAQPARVAFSTWGNLEETDDGDTSELDAYIFPVPKDRFLDIRVTSPDFVPMISLLAAETMDESDWWSVSHTADDAGGATLQGEVPHDGEYVAFVSSPAESSGLYRLEVRGSRQLRSDGRWHLVSTQTDRDSYLDTARIQSTQGDVVVWMRTEYHEPQRLDSGGRYDVTLVQLRIDCTAERYQTRAHALRYEGGVVDSGTLPQYEREWESVLPETIGETLMQEACRYAVPA